MKLLPRALLFFFLLLGFVSSAGAKFTEIVKTFPSLPSAYKEEQFNKVQKAFDDRATLFLTGKQFRSYEANRTEQDLQEEYKNIQEWRSHAWYSDATGEMLTSRPDFMVAQSLLRQGFYRRPNIIAFDYNHTDDSYNSSSIILNGYRFLALEAPMDKTLDNFFKLLQNYQVNRLVRLSSPTDKESIKSVAYWAGKITNDTKTQQTFLDLPFVGSKSHRISLPYYAITNWTDNQGVDPKILLKTLEDLRADYDPNTDLIAVHCGGGVGRTGTFIAGFLILQEIDRQIAAGTPIDKLDFSIEKIVMQLSLQRIHMVGAAPQYVTLHQLADLYISQLKQEKK